MPRTKGARTGQKHKRKRVEPATDAVDAWHESRVAALQAAETAAEAAFAQVQRENQPVAASVREWLQEAVDDVVRWELEDLHRQQVEHDLYEAAATACAEAYSRRYAVASAAERQSSRALSLNGPYRAAY